MLESTKYFPETIKHFPIWILWKKEVNNKGKITKVLYSSKYNGRASSTNPDTWDTFKNVKEKYDAEPERYNGIGIVLSKEYSIIFIDIDHCIVNGEYNENAKRIINSFHGQYIELSQSGEGVHILAKGIIPYSFKNSTDNIEMYSEKRFVAMTGNAIVLGEPTVEQSAIDFVFNTYHTKKKNVEIRHSAHHTNLLKDDKYIVQKASEHGSKFPLLYSGNWSGAGYGSQSEADYGLCIILAFWTDANPESINRIFRTSGLYREKWEREKYRTDTITRACNDCRETLSEFIARKNREEVTKLEKTFIEEW